jgi:hypothetical protein
MATLPFYQAITVYDTPQIMAAQILEGEAGLSSFKNLFFSPENLSPEERSSLSDMWFEPDDKLSRLFMETATNPFVWASFLLSPVGAKALNAGKSVFTPLAKYASQNKKGLGWGSWLVTPVQEMKGSNLDRIMQYAPDQVLNVNQRIAVTSNAARELAKEALENRMKAVHGRSFKWNGDEFDLDVTRYLNGTQEREMLQEFLDDVAVIKSGDYAGRKVAYPTVQIESAETWYGAMHPQAAQYGTKRSIMADPDLAGDDQAYASTVERILARSKGEQQAARNSFFGGDLKNSGTTAPYWKQAKLEEQAGSLPQGMTRGNRAFELYWKEHGWGLGEATPRIKVDHRREDAVFSGNLVAEIQAKYGGKAERYAKLLSNAEKEAFVFAVGDEAKYQGTRTAMGGVTEEVGDFAFDEGKVDGLVGALRRKFEATKGQKDVGDFAALLNSSENFEGMDAVMSMIGVENLLKVSALKSPAESKKLLKQMLTVSLEPGSARWKNELYFARTAGVVGRINGKTPHFISDMQSNVYSEAPYAAAIIYPNNLAPITKGQRAWDPEFLERIQSRDANHLTLRGFTMIGEGKDRIRNAAAKQQAAVFVGSDIEKAHTRYVTRMVTTGVYETHAAPAHLRAGNDEAVDLLLDKGQGAGGFLKANVGGKEVTVRANEKLGNYPEVRTTLSDLTDMAIMREGDDVRRQWFKRNVMPNMLHTMGPRYLAHYNQTLQQRGLAKWFSSSIAGKMIEKTGETGKRFVESMRQFANPDARYNIKDPSNALASYLYGTHLGVNMSSVILNLTQPLIGAALHGRFDDVLVAYAQGFKEVATYVGKRLQLGLNPTAEAKEAAMLASFKHMGGATGGRNILGISATSEEMIDGFIKKQRSNKPMDRLNDALLFGFTTSEMMNRSVAAHLWERINKRARVPLNSQGYLDDAERFIQTYQFGAGPLNTPRAFQEVGLLTNPLARMFMSFPVRSFSSTFMETPLMGGEDRWKGLLRTVGRGLGLSALVWETTKVGLGIDISKGLFAEGSTGFLNPERLADPSESVVPLPPIVDIPVDALRAFSTGDQQLMSTVVSRLFPGGVAVARAVNLAPEAPRVSALGNLPGALQTTFVGWDQPLPSGEVPVFRGDGTLIEYRTPAEIVARGVGLDMGQWQEQGALDNYLAKNREAILAMRQEYVRALASNNMQQAAAVQRSFEKKFKVPLTVSEDQVKRFLRAQEVGRTERSLDRIDPALRPQYAAMVDQAGFARNVVGGVQSGPTAGKREREGLRTQEEVVAEVLRRQQAVGPAATQSYQSFGT